MDKERSLCSCVHVVRGPVAGRNDGASVGGFTVSSLAQAIGIFSGEIDIEPTPGRVAELFDKLARYDEDFADVRGQEMVKRALTVAASGNHNLLILPT